MVTKRILIFGGESQAGKALQRAELARNWTLYAPSRADCDVTRAGDVAKAFRSAEPDLVLNLAELNDKAACEIDPDATLRLNFEAVATMAAFCTEMNAPLIQLSTDQVFDGQDAAAPYRPDDLLSPLNLYGDSKMLGEEAARHGLYWHTIIRTGPIFSAEGNNDLTRLLHQIDVQEEISAAEDRVASPLSAQAVAEALALITEAIFSGRSGCFGTFHLGGGEAVSQHAFAEVVAELYAPHTSQRAAIRATRAAELPSGNIALPLYTALDNEKAARLFNIPPRAWRDDLAEAVAAYAQQRAQALIDNHEAAPLFKRE